MKTHSTNISKKFKKIFIGYCLRMDLKNLLWDSNRDSTLKFAGSHIGRFREYKTDVKLKISIEEIA